ncbi:ROK family protein [Microbacterium sp. P05]|uniref:ROK family transcriptional regulator n=1 Tax=Microbacterium sp. P05 TaxID=3366948 RepID=UPI00374636BA
MPTSQRGLHRELLELIRRSEGATRAALARDTGRSRSVVAHTVAELIAEGLVVDGAVAAQRATRGRPPMQLRIAARSGYLGGVDIAHDGVAVAVASVSGLLLCRRQQPFDADADGPGALALARRLLLQSFAQLGAPPTPLALGLALPFPVHPASAMVQVPPALASWQNLDPTALLSRSFGCTVRYANDANLGAAAEHRAEASRPTAPQASLLYVRVGAGIGTGFVIGERVYAGANGLGGEIGHSAVVGGSILCRCGRIGCLEAEVSPTALARRIGLATVDDLPAAAAGRGGVALREAGHAIGRVVAEFSNFLDPARVVIGGSLGTLGGPILEGVREAFAEHGHTEAVRRMPVSVSRLDGGAELVGAVELAAQHLYAAAA